MIIGRRGNMIELDWNEKGAIQFLAPGQITYNRAGDDFLIHNHKTGEKKSFAYGSIKDLTPSAMGSASAAQTHLNGLMFF